MTVWILQNDLNLLISPSLENNVSLDAAWIYVRFVDIRSIFLPRSGLIISKTSLYNVDPLKPHFYTVKRGFTEVYIIFLILQKKERLWVLVGTASPRRF